MVSIRSRNYLSDLRTQTLSQHAASAVSSPLEPPQSESERLDRHKMKTLS